jgi:hypothetical protein
MTAAAAIRHLGLAFAAFTALALAAAPAAARQVRRALVVGNNVGADPARALRYAEQEAVRLGQLLERSGDFGAVPVLQGAGRAEVERALAAAGAELAAARAAGRATLFLFYYSGHGDGEALELGSSRLPLRDLRNYLEHLAADVRVAFVDACQSGALTGVKGGRRAPAYEVKLADPGNVRGMAIVTSSTASELSQESDDLKGSYFSHNLMVGLQGLADGSRDGQVTLAELYQFASRRTLASTAATLVGGQHPTYDYRLSGTGEVVLTRTRASDARLYFPREAGVTYTVLAGGEIEAELASSADQELYVSLPAGRYRVVRRALGRVADRTFALAAGARATLDPATMTVVAPGAGEGQRKKAAGGGARHALGALVAGDTSVVPGAAPVLAGAGLAYARAFSALTLQARVAVSAFDGGAADRRASFVRVGPAIDLLVPALDAGAFALLIGPTAGAPVVRQRGEAGVSYSYGFAYGGMATAFARAGALWLSLSATAGGELFRLDGVRVHRLTAGSLLGTGVSF